MIPMLGNTGVNPFEGCEPSVPEGEKLDFGSEDFRQYERLGEYGFLAFAPQQQARPDKQPLRRLTVTGLEMWVGCWLVAWWDCVGLVGLLACER